MPREVRNVDAFRARTQNLSRETVIADKFQAMVALGPANGRMKDYDDIWLLSQLFPSDNHWLARAIAAVKVGRR